MLLYNQQPYYKEVVIGEAIPYMYLFRRGSGSGLGGLLGGGWWLVAGGLAHPPRAQRIMTVA